MGRGGGRFLLSSCAVFTALLRCRRGGDIGRSQCTGEFFEGGQISYSVTVWARKRVAYH